jgi:hypothetical protein
MDSCVNSHPSCICINMRCPAQAVRCLNGLLEGKGQQQREPLWSEIVGSLARGCTYREQFEPKWMDRWADLGWINGGAVLWSFVGSREGKSVLRSFVLFDFSRIWLNKRSHNCRKRRFRLCHGYRLVGNFFIFEFSASCCGPGRSTYPSQTESFIEASRTNRVWGFNLVQLPWGTVERTFLLPPTLQSDVLIIVSTQDRTDMLVRNECGLWRIETSYCNHSHHETNRLEYMGTYLTE